MLFQSHEAHSHCHRLCRNVPQQAEPAWAGAVFSQPALEPGDCRVRAPSVDLRHGSRQGHSSLRGIRGVCVCVCVSAGGSVQRTHSGQETLLYPALPHLTSGLDLQRALLCLQPHPPGRAPDSSRSAEPSSAIACLPPRQAGMRREAKSALPEAGDADHQVPVSPGPRAGFLGTAWPTAGGW